MPSLSATGATSPPCTCKGAPACSRTGNRGRTHSAAFVATSCQRTSPWPSSTRTREKGRAKACGGEGSEGKLAPAVGPGAVCALHTTATATAGAGGERRPRDANPASAHGARDSRRPGTRVRGARMPELGVLQEEGGNAPASCGLRDGGRRLASLCWTRRCWPGTSDGSAGGGEDHGGSGLAGHDAVVLGRDVPTLAWRPARSIFQQFKT